MITNKHNLPQSIVNFAGDDSHVPEPHKYSVTEILGPIRELLLYRKYYAQVERDVSDSVPALFGTAVHKVLEESTPDNPKLLKEYRLQAQFGEDTLTGRADLINLETLSIEDYKTCSVSKVTKQDFEDFKKQGLSYAFLYFKQTGTILKHLKFYCLMKDWSKVKSVLVSGYPTSPVYVWEYNIEESNYDYIEGFITGRIALINYYLEKGLPECSDEERWYTGTKYAVYKNAGSKRADYVADTEKDAHNYISNKCNGSGEIEVRKGDNIKCLYYCAVCKFCEKER